MQIASPTRSKASTLSFTPHSALREADGIGAPQCRAEPKSEAPPRLEAKRHLLIGSVRRDNAAWRGLATRGASQRGPADSQATETEARKRSLRMIILLAYQPGTAATIPRGKTHKWTFTPLSSPPNFGRGFIWAI